MSSPVAPVPEIGAQSIELPIAMSASSSAGLLAPAARPEDAAPLPLIRCPRCNVGVMMWGLRTARKPGRHYYNCYYHALGQCTFWRWENKHIDCIRARWPDEHCALLLQNQAELKNIFLVCIGTLVAVLFMLANKF